MTMLDQKSAALEIEQRFEASPERVFDAWTGREWGNWLPPRNAIGEVVAIDPVPGGAYQVRMTMADGRVIEVEGNYVEVVRPTRLVLTWRPGYGPGGELTITVSLARDGDGTLMRFRMDGFADVDMRGRYEDGWTGTDGSFDKLAERIAS